VLSKWIVDFLKARKFRVKVNGGYSGWQNVTSGIPQGSVLGPLLFLIYINDLMECCDESYIYVFADDAKIYRHIQCPDDCMLLHYTLAGLQSWSQKRLLSLNTKKCCVVSYGRSVDKTVTYTRAYMMLGIIKRNFRHLTIPTFVLLYKTMVRSHLDYCCSVWALYKKGDIEALEKVQKRATKILSSLRHISYPDHLKVCKLTTLHYRQIRGDMIEVYKIVSGKYDSAISPTLIISDTHKTRGNDLRLQKSCLK